MTSIDYEIDRNARRVMIRFAATSMDACCVRRCADFGMPCRRSPATIRSVTCGTFTGNFGFDDIRTLSEAWRLFCRGADLGRRTAVLSFDRFAPIYLKAIHFCFAGRALAVFRSLDDAQRWIDRSD